MASTTPYSADFFQGQAGGSEASAAVIVPIVMELLHPTSVADVGCGVGGWLAAFARAGVTDFQGYDGDYVDRGALRIDAARFTPVELRSPFSLGRRFDLAVCLEVGEHLPESCAEHLVAALADSAPCVLFSAAVPLQGGTGHVNEQPQSWWAAKFATRGMRPLDAVRPRIWNDDCVAWWYRQNMLLYVHADHIAASPALSALTTPSNAMILDVVHPRLLAKRNQKPLRSLAGAGAWFRAIRRAVGGK